jgi:hypothetical protein
MEKGNILLVAIYEYVYLGFKERKKKRKTRRCTYYHGLLLYKSASSTIGCFILAGGREKTLALSISRSPGNIIALK